MDPIELARRAALQRIETRKENHLRFIEVFATARQRAAWKWAMGKGDERFTEFLDKLVVLYEADQAARVQAQQDASNLSPMPPSE